ncbi:MAG: helix-turn-helix domain-containing protein [Bacteroidales bacterium]|nr:helix-turn-helix domain-containing protein [Candidatus Cacconaster equifaecalis]
MTHRKKKESLIDYISRTLESEKLYLDSNLTLESLASKLSSNRDYVSKAINSTGLNFSRFINALRASYAIDLLLEKDHLETSVADIADLSGFASTRKMNCCIKQSTGVTASALRKRVFNPSEL